MTSTGYVVDFEAPPPIGHHIRAKTRSRLRWLELVNVEEYTRRDGAQSFVLTWSDDKGYLYTSGLRSKSLTLMKSVS